MDPSIQLLCDECGEENIYLLLFIVPELKMCTDNQTKVLIINRAPVRPQHTPTSQ